MLFLKMNWKDIKKVLPIEILLVGAVFLIGFSLIFTGDFIVYLIMFSALSMVYKFYYKVYSFIINGLQTI